MILENRRTREKLEISHSEFRKQFAKEIQVALDSYIRTQLNKPYFRKIDKNSLVSDFYFNLQWNFNNFGNSSWYIERM